MPEHPETLTLDRPGWPEPIVLEQDEHGWPYYGRAHQTPKLDLYEDEVDPAWVLWVSELVPIRIAPGTASHAEAARLAAERIDTEPDLAHLRPGGGA